MSLRISCETLLLNLVLVAVSITGPGVTGPAYAAGVLVLKNAGYDKDGNPVSGRNQFEQDVTDFMASGVDFYFFQNTTRGHIRKVLPAVGVTAWGATAELIDGVKYTTAGVTSIAEFQQRG